MLTQDDSVRPNMSAAASPQGGLQRSSWKAEAIRRGDLKISGPIPITEDVPLNEEEEEEFEKHRTLSPIMSKDTPVYTAQNPSEPVQASTPSPPAAQVEPVPKAPSPPDEITQGQPEHRASPPAQLSVPTQASPERHRRSATEPMPISSPIPPPPETPTQTSTRRKRKSGIRNVFRKMFGRKSRDESDEFEVQLVQRSQTQRQSQRVSDLGLKRVSSERQLPARRGRISDLNVEEPAPINPLGSHLPFPMNVNAPQEASPPHEYLRFEAPTPDMSRRRATLPNVHAIADTQSLDGGDKRLETWEERPDGEIIPSPEIGIALSSPPHARQSTSAQEKRRSRSAGNLRELAKGRPSVERRRSEEIRYWRNSYASASVYSTNTPRPRTAQTVETVRSADADAEGERDLPALEEVVTKTVPVHAPTVVTQPTRDTSQMIHPLPVEAFNFGNLRSDFSDDEDSSVPDAPPARSEKRLSIEDRVKDLEANMRTLDASVRRLSTSHASRQTIVLESAPKGRRSSRARSTSASSHRQSSLHRSTNASANAALHLRQYDDEDVASAPAPAPAPRPASPAAPPLSAVTESPAPHNHNPNHIPSTTANANPTANTQISTLLAQLASLQSALHHERHARKTLEAQFTALKRDVIDLHALVHKVASASARSPNYPTPSPDGIVLSGERERRGSTPRAYEREGEGSRRSEVESDAEDGGGAEDWATPKESGVVGFF